MSDKIREQYKAFSRRCYDSRQRSLDPRLHQHAGPIEHGGYIADPKTATAFAAWQAALAQQPATAVPDGETTHPLAQIEWWANAYEQEGGHAQIVEMLRAYMALLAAPAAPVAVQPLPYWAPCNPACDPELNGSRSKLCDCAQATAALAAPPAAEQPDTVAVPRELLGSLVLAMKTQPSCQRGVVATCNCLDCIEDHLRALLGKEGEA